MESNINTRTKKINKTAKTRADFKSLINALLVFAAPPIKISRCFDFIFLSSGAIIL